MFLFDRERTGRSPFRLGTKPQPELVWETTLRQLPVKGPESTAVIDEAGNLYFGCHDNSIYSLDPSGKVRWQFTTEDKVYASPLMLGDRLYFCCNKSDVLCLSTSGDLLWSFSGFRELARFSKTKRVLGNLRSYRRYDYEFGKYMKINAWGSPNLLGNNGIVVNLYGIGVVVLDAVSGKVRWEHDLGIPWNHLSGTAITKSSNKDIIVAASQSGSINGIDENGKRLWSTPLKRGFNTWGNPSIDPDEKVIYCSTSKVNTSAELYKIDLAGKKVWSKSIDGGIRSSVGITRGEQVIVLTMKGELMLVDKKKGDIVHRRTIATGDRGLWTSACIDQGGDLLINTKLSQNSGSLLRVSSTGETKWEIKYGKALATPVIDQDGCIFTATWEGKYLKYKS